MANPVSPSELARAIAECAREPIHIPGATQAFGTALILDGGGRVTQVSKSCERHLGARPTELLGADVREALDGALQAAFLRVASLRLDQVTHVRATVAGAGFDVSGWRRPDGAVVLSLVPGDEQAVDVIGVVEEVRELQGRLGEASSLGDLCDQVATWLRAVSGLDRVMIYRFDGEGNGEVISEARRADVEPFLGLHYPASDIPPQARALYVRCPLRVLADVHAEDDPLLALDPSAPPADLSLCLVRAHSPVHRKYLENMGVRASLVVSILRGDGHLWGLVACHHYAPFLSPHRVRLLSELLGSVIGLRVQLQEESERRAAEARAAEAHHVFVRLMATAGSQWRSAMASPRLTELVRSGGSAFLFEKQVWTVGKTPPAEAILALASTLGPALVEGIYATDRGDDLPLLTGFEAVASGVMAARLRPAGDAWMFWFRPEQVRSVVWAGRHDESVIVESGVARLLPRQSFAAWAEEVRGRAEPWTQADVICARRVRESIVDVLLQVYSSQVLTTQLDLLRVKRACEAAGQPLAVLDVEAAPVFLNSAWSSLLGETDRALPWFAQVSALFVAPEVGVAIRDVLAGRRPTFVGECDVARGDARVLVAVDPVRTEAGLLAGAVVVLTDLREHLRMEEERRSSQARLDRAGRLEALALVTGTVAHDFNNLLTSILCETALLSEEMASQGAPLGGLQQIERTARKAADICRQLLAHSGKGTFVVSRVDLVTLCREVMDIVSRVVDSHVKLRLEGAQSSLFVVADPMQLSQVLMNLIVNAAEASVGHHGEPLEEADVTVTLEAVSLSAPRGFASIPESAPSGDYAVLHVRDRGIGIAAKDRLKIYDPFYTTKSTGRGLGLAAALGVARSHGGFLDLESEVGAGARFSLWLPAAPALVPEARSDAGVSGATGKRVLVVDDELATLRVVRIILEREGYQVVDAATVGAAKTVLADAGTRLDLVFSDLRLPDGSGRDVLAAAAARDADLPVILTSGASDGLSPLSAATPNLVGFLSKPYALSQLRETIRAGLRRAR